MGVAGGVVDTDALDREGAGLEEEEEDDLQDLRYYAYIVIANVALHNSTVLIDIFEARNLCFQLIDTCSSQNYLSNGTSSVIS